MESQVAIPPCPVCGFTSIYTDGDGPCSVRCALKLACETCAVHEISLPAALSVVREEAEARGLPQEPHVRDIREPKYRYVLVQEPRLSWYWRIDRSLLASGLNVEYLWTSRGPRQVRGRIYRFASSLLTRLPESMLDYKVRNLSDRELYHLSGTRPDWYFIAVK